MSSVDDHIASGQAANKDQCLSDYGQKDIERSLSGLARVPRKWDDFCKATDWSHLLG